jgi:hypothetical protein
LWVDLGLPTCGASVVGSLSVTRAARRRQEAVHLHVLSDAPPSRGAFLGGDSFRLVALRLNLDFRSTGWSTSRCMSMAGDFLRERAVEVCERERDHAVHRQIEAASRSLMQRQT